MVGMQDETNNSPFTVCSVYICEVHYLYVIIINYYIIMKNAWHSMTCFVVDCGPAPRIENGFALHGGTSVVYVCNIGYDLDGPSSIVCNRANGMWQLPPICKRRQ